MISSLHFCHANAYVTMRMGVAVTATFTIRKALCGKAKRYLLFQSCSCQNGVQFCSDKTTCSDKIAFRLSRCNELQKDRKRLWRHKLLLQLQTSVLLSHFVLDHFDIPYQGHQPRTAFERVRLRDSCKLRASLFGTFLRLWWKDVVNHCLEFGRDLYRSMEFGIVIVDP